jgi:hypothetical protein
MRHTLRTFGELDNYLALHSGQYTIAYNDATHLESNDWRTLLNIDINRPPNDSTLGDAHHNYTMMISIDSRCEKYEPQLRDLLALCMTRIGLLERRLMTHDSRTK